MVGIIERISSLAGTEAAKAINLAHTTFTGGMADHGHAGRAMIETVAEVCRNHPNLVGIGTGLLVEQILVEEKRRHEAHLARPTAQPQPAAAAASTVVGGPQPVAGPASTSPGDPSLPADHPDHPGHHLALPHLEVPHIHVPDVHLPHVTFSHLRPGKVAAEVFGALIVLKLGAVGAHLLRRKKHGDVWFEPAARIHLISGTIASYYLVKSLASPKVSAWRNAAVALFATDAIKPLLKHRPAR